MKDIYTITEYSSFIRSDVSYNRDYIPMKDTTFDALENFILSNSQLTDFMNISLKKGIGKTITVKNYVGVVCTKDGSTIEILPKIYISNKDTSYTKKVFIKMLRTVKDMPFKSVQKAQIQIENISMLDIFIDEFLTSLEVLIKQGLKSSYTSKHENRNFFKGKLDYSKQIKYNNIHKERFYLKHDVFSIDCIENRLIKSTLILLQRYSNNYQQPIKKILSYFDNVSLSSNYKVDFLQCNIDISNKHYKTILRWCEVFLMGSGFTSFIGDDYAHALLFPMEKVFESYISNLVKKCVAGRYSVKIQDRSHYLIDEPIKRFTIIPDIILQNDIETIILDTKWKLLNVHSCNYGISQQDMYQMYVYAKKYSAKKVILIYPLSDDNFKSKDIYFKTDDITVQVKFIEL